jgi:hypothetical protein
MEEDRILAEGSLGVGVLGRLLVEGCLLPGGEGRMNIHVQPVAALRISLCVDDIQPIATHRVRPCCA